MPGYVSRFSPWWPFRQGLSLALFGGVVILAACGPSFQQMAAAECQGVGTDTAYAECERRLSQELANERLGYIMRSQVTGGPAGRLRPQEPVRVMDGGMTIRASCNCQAFWALDPLSWRCAAPEGAASISHSSTMLDCRG